MHDFTIKEGYQLTNIPGRIFIERTDEPGKYFCPYCDARCGENASMCSNCGKSLGVAFGMVLFLVLRVLFNWV